LEAVFAGMQVKYEGWVERVKEAEDRESELVREIQGLKAELSKRPRPVSVPETRENVELQGYFETWLQSQPFAPQ
jgi:hypothetical protein